MLLEGGAAPEGGVGSARCWLTLMEFSSPPEMTWSPASEKHTAVTYNNTRKVIIDGGPRVASSP